MMGIHRNVIHQKFGNFILLGTVLIDAEVSEYNQPIDYNPCLECKLCVAACPVGAISPEGDFNFSACYSHNYREFMGGFTDWTENVADSKNRFDYRRRVSDTESASMWQSLSFGANYKAAYCLSVCPAGEDVIGPYLADKKSHLKEVVKPLQEKEETVYVLKNSDAEEHVARRFPNKKIKHVGNSLRPNGISGFLGGLPRVFQPGKSAGLKATYHFTFTGDETREATVVIRTNGSPSRTAITASRICTSPLTARLGSASWPRKRASSGRSFGARSASADRQDCSSRLEDVSRSRSPRADLRSSDLRRGETERSATTCYDAQGCQAESRLLPGTP
jgi:NAD-dependent dihydropyrimidine dehydrogenase PreA subunit